MDSLSIDFSVQLIEFKVNQDGTISDLQTMQSSKGCAQDMVLLLMKRFSWKPLQQESGTNGNHYLMLVKQGGKVYMPQPIIITNDSEANFMIKQMNKNNLFISK